MFSSKVVGRAAFRTPVAGSLLGHPFTDGLVMVPRGPWGVLALWPLGSEPGVPNVAPVLGSLRTNHNDRREGMTIFERTRRRLRFIVVVGCLAIVGVLTGTANAEPNADF